MGGHNREQWEEKGKTNKQTKQTNKKKHEKGTGETNRLLLN